MNSKKSNTVQPLRSNKNNNLHSSKKKTIENHFEVNDFDIIQVTDAELI